MTFPSELLKSLLLANLIVDERSENLFFTPHNFPEVQQKLKNIFDEIQLEKEYSREELSSQNDFFYLNIPISVADTNVEKPTYNYRKVKVEVKQYSSLKEFMKSMFKQIPIKERKVDLFLQTLKFDQEINIDGMESNIIDYYRKELQKMLNNELITQNRKIVKKRSLTDDSIFKHIQMLYVYADMIEGHGYADNKLCVLRVIPWKSSAQSEGIHIRFENPEFYPVCRNYFDSINILINNREHEISFDLDSIEPVYIQFIYLCPRP